MLRDRAILNVDAFFDVNMRAEMFEALDLEILDTIDGAKLLDAHTGSIVTRFGVTGITNLSTGCKAVLIYRLLEREQMEADLNINGCGWNAVQLLFEIAKDASGKVRFFLDNLNSILYLKRAPNRWYTVNDCIVTDDLFSTMVRRDKL